MRILPTELKRFRNGSVVRRRERGFVLIITSLLIMMSIMLIYVTASLQLLSSLKQEIKLVEKKQIRQLEQAGAQPIHQVGATTNAIPIEDANSSASPPTK